MENLIKATGSSTDMCVCTWFCTVSALSSDACVGPPLAPAWVNKQLHMDAHMKVMAAVRRHVSWAGEAGGRSLGSSGEGASFQAGHFFPFPSLDTSIYLKPQSGPVSTQIATPCFLPCAPLA